MKSTVTPHLSCAALVVASVLLVPAAATPQTIPKEPGACNELLPGVTDLPVGQVEHAVHPTDDQVAALDELRAASLKAAKLLKASCPTEMSLTPVGRLDALEKRLNSMVQAVQIVRGPLQAFYNSLSDEQKQRFEKIGRGTTKVSSANGLTNLCSEQSANFTQLPLQGIEQSLEPNPQQKTALDQLSTAS
jgi:hypothetical protein